MASIESLLNPLPSSEVLRRCYNSNSNNNNTSSPRPSSFPLDRVKKSRIPKDAPIFNPGKVRGELRYPPCEDQDELLVKEHKRFQIHPMGHIAEYPRHIPYSSEKKSFLERTGRESFEVFQYTFKIPGEDKAWTVMWDYNIGLVRTTHLFKCNDYSKTTPAKMLNANPGLRDICHSITGGALAAQGYWMPFEAAKAVAATFCWHIRYALTPLFGKDFPSLCIPPDSPQFGKMIIDPAIVRRSTELANKYRLQEVNSRMCAPQQHHQQQHHHHQQEQRSSLGKSLLSYHRESSSRDFPSPSNQNAHHNDYSDKEAVETAGDGDQEERRGRRSSITVFSNSFTPVNLNSMSSSTATTDFGRGNKKPGKHFPDHREKKRSMATTRTTLLPSIEDILRFERGTSSSSTRANPLKRRLGAEQDSAEYAESSTAVTSRNYYSRRPSCARKAEARHRGYEEYNSRMDLEESSDEIEEDDDDDYDDDEDDTDIDIPTDDISSYSSSSDSDDDLDIISDLSMLTSSESEDAEDKHRRRLRDKKKTKKQYVKRHADQTNPKRANEKKKNRRENQNQTHTLSSSSSPPPLSSSSSLPLSSSESTSLLPKRKHHRRDREAAEALLTLQSRSGSSLSADDKTVSTESEKEDRYCQMREKQQQQQQVEHVVGFRDVSSSAGATKEEQQQQGHTIKRPRRASF